MRERTADELIELLGLAPHAEGGWYAFCEASGQLLDAAGLPGYPGDRESCSVIYYLLKRGEVSRWHWLRSAEVWTWHAGGSLRMTLGGKGREQAPAPERELPLGPRLELGEQFQVMAPPNSWQTTRVVDGDYALVSCVVSPAYTDEDCLLPEHPLQNEILG